MANSDATNENVNLLLTKLMTEKHCKQESYDYEACVENFVPQRVDGSHVDQSLQRVSLRKCAPYKELAQKCMQDDKKQQAILKQAARVQACREERNALAKCQRAHPQDSQTACDRQVLEMMMCGLVGLVAKQMKKEGGAPKQ